MKYLYMQTFTDADLDASIAAQEREKQTCPYSQWDRHKSEYLNALLAEKRRREL
jgi:hypothetical protein